MKGYAIYKGLKYLQTLSNPEESWKPHSKCNGYR